VSDTYIGKQQCGTLRIYTRLGEYLIGTVNLSATKVQSSVHPQLPWHIQKTYTHRHTTTQNNTQQVQYRLKSSTSLGNLHISDCTGDVGRNFDYCP